MSKEKEKPVKVNFVLYPSSIEKLKQLSTTQDRSMSSVLRLLIKQAFDKQFNQEQ